MSSVFELSQADFLIIRLRCPSEYSSSYPAALTWRPYFCFAISPAAPALT
jgi:hypothetical protein